MKKTISQKWVSQMAEKLIKDVIYQMSGISLQRTASAPKNLGENCLECVFGETTGDYNIRMQLKTTRTLFERLANNMLGGLPESDLEVEEYATEYFNIVCGRFISELYLATGHSARFLPTIYERPPNVTDLETGQKVNKVYFISDNNEPAIFTWLLASKDC